ncbi:hypothetical protein H9L05_19540 [Hymenobacter qilianensis]|uniref:Uncharacterized protein n=1 Tax=Hymenobacter qilianensis TaxID=1385715 RepID=A0A7H0GUU4_9BACT|nr:hypothetical protein [Hymenobacter qilianensis]QNP52060.1 hypothetical protein H9L05_19540 [Hymenobacter qilianensis]
MRPLDPADQVVGSYQLVAPSSSVVPATGISLQLTGKQALVRTGSAEVASPYEVVNNYVYLLQGASRIDLRIVSRDTLRLTSALGTVTNYVLHAE